MKKTHLLLIFLMPLISFGQSDNGCKYEVNGKKSNGVKIQGRIPCVLQQEECLPMSAFCARYEESGAVIVFTVEAEGFKKQKDYDFKKQFKSNMLIGKPQSLRFIKVSLVDAAEEIRNYDTELSSGHMFFKMLTYTLHYKNTVLIFNHSISTRSEASTDETFDALLPYFRMLFNQTLFLNDLE